MRRAARLCAQRTKRVRCAKWFHQMPNEWDGKLDAINNPDESPSLCLLAFRAAGLICRETLGWGAQEEIISALDLSKRCRCDRKRATAAIRLAARVHNVTLTMLAGVGFHVRLPDDLVIAVGLNPTPSTNQPACPGGVIRLTYCTEEAGTSSSDEVQKNRCMSLSPAETDPCVRVHACEDGKETETQSESVYNPEVFEPVEKAYEEMEPFSDDADIAMPAVKLGLALEQHGVPLGKAFERIAPHRVSARIWGALKKILTGQQLGSVGNSTEARAMILVDQIVERLTSSKFLNGQKYSKKSGWYFQPTVFWLIHGPGNLLGENLARIAAGEFDDFRRRSPEQLRDWRRNGGRD
jgi:hypothetical protein